MLSRKEQEQSKINIPCTFNWGAILAHGNHLDNFSVLVSRLVTDLHATEYQGSGIRKDIMRRVVENPDHGVMSALILLSLSEGRDATDEAAAVCLHSIATAQCIRKVLGRYIEFRKIPLAFLLAFCDMVQEWGRSSSLTFLPRIPDFGNPRFHSIRYDNGIRLELVYVHDYPQALQEEWHERIYRGILTNAKFCWNSNSQFHVSYYWQSSSGENNLLGSLEI
jgi:hypothetical protein